VRTKGFILLAGGAMVALIYMLSGCASIASGSQQSINVSSDPSEAGVKIYDSTGGVVYDSHTPATVSLRKGQGYFQGATYRVVIEKQGFKPKEVLIRSDLQVGWYVVGNFFIGGLIGWLIVDPLTGAMWTLSPESVNANLPRDAAAAPGSAEIRVVLLEDIPAGLIPELRPVNGPRS
jgi:hypothetical protein